MRDCIIVGSVALFQYSLNRNPPVDTDVWVSSEHLVSLSNLKKEVGNFDVAIVPQHILDLVPTEDGYATPDAIYTIKCSHAIYDIKWSKHKLDILHLKWNGCKIIPELYEALKLHWKEVHGNKDFLSLDKTKEQFFTDNVSYLHDHDFLHELVAYPNKPMYSNCLKEGHQVYIDRDKFKAMPFENQIRMFREEITVIAAERWLIPEKWRGKISWYQAYMLSLQKTVVSLTKGDYSYFLVDNLEHFIKPDYKMFEHLLTTLEIDR